MTKRKKITILILVGIILIAGGILGWAIKTGKIKPKADVAGALVPMPINLRSINPPPQTFNDVAYDHWAFQYIETITQKGLTNGCTNNIEVIGQITHYYCPDNNTSFRQQLAAFAARALYSLKPDVHVCTVNDPYCPQYFNDVSSSYMYYSVIQTAWKNGLFNNVPGISYPTVFTSTDGTQRTITMGQFFPNNQVNRNEIAWVLFNILGGSKASTKLPPAGDPTTCQGDSCLINRAEMAGWFASFLEWSYQKPDYITSPVLLDWDEPPVNTEDQTIGFQIWKKGPSDSAPQLIWTIDAAPDVGEGLENPSAGGNLLDSDFPASSTGQYTYYVCAFDSEGNFSGSADGGTADSGMCYNPATLTLTVSTQTANAATEPWTTISPTPTATPTPTPTSTKTKGRR